MKAAHGSVFKYGDNVDTDVIIPARYLNSSDPKELATHCMEDIDKDFVKNVHVGDIIVEEKSNKLNSAFFEEKAINYDISIKAVVANNKFNSVLNLISLQSVSIKTIINMSEKITKEMCKVIDENCINLSKVEKI